MVLDYLILVLERETLFYRLITHSIQPIKNQRPNLNLKEMAANWHWPALTLMKCSPEETAMTVLPMCHI